MNRTTHGSPASVWSRLPVFDRAKLIFMVAGFVSFLFSVFLWFFVDRELGLFVGLWVPAIHSLGSLVLTGERGRK